VRAVPPDAREGSTCARLARATSRAGVFLPETPVNQPSRPGPVGERPRAGDRRSREESATSFAGVATPPAFRLGRYFGVDLRFWLNLQAAHDLSPAEGEKDYSRVHSRADARPERSRVDKIWRL
jgi:hypothetical protein